MSLNEVLHCILSAFQASTPHLLQHRHAVCHNLSIRILSHDFLQVFEQPCRRSSAQGTGEPMFEHADVPKNASILHQAPRSHSLTSKGHMSHVDIRISRKTGHK